MNKITWTGNPFVDTGLAVLVAMSGKRTLREVTEDDLKKAFQDIKSLGNINRKLKAYSLVIGTNGPLTQTGYSNDALEKNLIKQVINTASLEYTGKKFTGFEGLKLLLHQSSKKSLKALTVNDFLSIHNNKEWKAISQKLIREFSDFIGKGDQLVSFDLPKKYQGQKPSKELLEKSKPNEGHSEKTKKLIKENWSELQLLKRRIQAPLDWGLSQYSVFVETLLEDVLTNNNQALELCEVTGLRATNALKVIPAKMVEKLEFSPSEKKKIENKDYQIGREWFPLAGSLGNDAQALPAGSRSPHISSLALLMAQLLPLGVIAISRNVNGKMKSYLVCLQFNLPEVNELIVKGIYEKVVAKIGFASEKNKLKTIGTEKGSKSLALFLLNKFRELKDHQEFHNLNHLHLNVWFFSNFGTSADCDYFEIPNPSLRFLQTAAQQYYDEIKEMLVREVQSGYRYSLLEAIERKADYEPLYPYEGSKGISLELKQQASQLLKSDLVEEDPEKLLEPEVDGAKEQDSEKDQKSKKKKRKQESLVAQLEKEAKGIKRDESLRNQYADLIREIKLVQSRPASKDLFKFYQINVVRVNPVALSVAERIALFLKQNLTGEKGQNLLSEMKQNNFKITAAKIYLVQMAREGKLTLDEYTCLFPMETRTPLRVSNKGWKYIWFYLNHDSPSDNQTNTIGETEMFTHPKIKAFAKDYFDYFLEKRSLRKFELYVLEPFEKSQVTSRTMQEWYCELAKSKEGYTSEEWDDLCKDENGNDAIYEVRFQMRLHFINLYREFKNNKPQSIN